jgi:RNA polymerase primary sigma factor
VGEFDDRPREEPSVVPFRGFESVDAAEWSALIEHGRLQGRVHAEQVTHVLRNVELTGEVLDSVRHICDDEGITLDETLDDADVGFAGDDGEDDEDDEQGGATATRAAALLDLENDETLEADEHLLSRRRRRRLRRSGPRTEGTTSDGVRMYLREIGQVDLLTGDDERRLAQLIEAGHLAAARIDEAGDSLDSVETRRLMRAIQRGERAKSELT